MSRETAILWYAPNSKGTIAIVDRFMCLVQTIDGPHQNGLDRKGPSAQNGPSTYRGGTEEFAALGG